ncbi:MAG TPA: galactokinase [Atopostipes sp.]|nr:galactokinase [Atopostipes sp.]
MADEKQLFEQFEKVFGYPGTGLYFSPGRINLIGEHTDYNGGKVFPCAITVGTYAVVSKKEGKEVHAYSGNFPELGISSFSLENLQYEKESGWTNYLKGMLLYIQEMTGEITEGFDIYIYGTIPNGASLSSSASLEVLMGVIANDLYGLDLSGETLAKLGQRVENDFLGLNTGIMDQFIIANAKKDHALFLDTQTLTYEQIPLKLPNHKIVIMNSMAKRELVDSEYNTRRQQCEEAVSRLNKELSISTLGELTIEEFEKYRHLIDDDVLEKRAKHAVYENIRTEQATEALRNNELEDFGRLMDDSHLSLHEDYEVTIPETDLLVRSAWKQPGTIGARMTGGGFGGCCIALVENDQVKSFKTKVEEIFEEAFQYRPEIYLAETQAHARKLN